MDNENIKEILEFDFQSQGERIEINEYERDILKDCITNLQEKSNNQAEEINRLYEQREKFMKKYGYLKEENESLKELNVCVGCNNNPDYKSRNKKAIEYVEHHKFNKFGDIDCGEAEEIINILNGGDEEC